MLLQLVGRPALHRWLRQGRVPDSPLLRTNGQELQNKGLVLGQRRPATSARSISVWKWPAFRHQIRRVSRHTASLPEGLLSFEDYFTCAGYTHSFGSLLYRVALGVGVIVGVIVTVGVSVGEMGGVGVGVGLPWRAIEVGFSCFITFSQTSACPGILLLYALQRASIRHRCGSVRRCTTLPRGNRVELGGAFPWRILTGPFDGLTRFALHAFQSFK